MKTLISIVSLLVFVGCGDALSPAGERSTGLRATEATGGPKVIYDTLAKPLPEIPLPNDQATRLDPTTTTGRRLNVSFEAVTAYERRARREFNRMDGFGTYAPALVTFDAPLDVADLSRRHNDNDDFRDDAVFLINVDPSCERFGEEVAIDMGRGRFPITFYKRDEQTPDPEAPDGYVLGGGNPVFDFDIQGTRLNLLFPDANEDQNGNGVLDPGEDQDEDGVLDVANFIDPTACDELTTPKCLARCAEEAETKDCFDACSIERDRCIADNLMTFYERETNTLIMRPVWPLAQQCRHAVVLTKRLKGEDGRSVESPFMGVNPREQTQGLEPLGELLPRYGLTLDDVAFAWTYTTGSMTQDFEALRQGLYGQGPFKNLKEEFPPESFTLWTMGDLVEPKDPEDTRTAIDGACGGAVVTWLWSIGLGEWEPNLCALENDLATLGGVVAGTFEAPDLLVDDDDVATPRYPADNDEIWRIDVPGGTAVYGRAKVTFWCGLPIERPSEECEEGNPDGVPFCRPFPTSLYAHGYGGSRAEIINHMGRHAAMGQALCALDGFGHGLNVWSQDASIAEQYDAAIGLFEAYKAGAFKLLLSKGRDRDLNNDGSADSGGDMWTADLFHTRDMVRQSTLEYMQFVRILRSFDGANKYPDTDRLLGDLTGDGKVDIGGQSTIGMWGISLGGIISGMMAGTEPSLDSVSPNAGGAGLTDIAVRSTQAGVPQAVVLPMVGPFVAGCLPTDDHQRPLAEGAEPSDRSCIQAFDGPGTPGVMRLAFLANNRSRTARVPIGELPGVKVGDKIVLRNLDNGEESTTRVNARGWFRAAVAADAMDAVSRRGLLGLTDGDTEPAAYAQTPHLADRLSITIHVGDTDEVRHTVDTWLQESTFQGTIYPSGAPLVALQEGFGFRRNSPKLRRFLNLAQHGLSPADPGVWGAHTYLVPIDTQIEGQSRNGGNTRVLMMPTAGDRNVPVNTGVAMGRVTGLFGSWLREPDTYGPEHGWREMFVPDARYGTSIDQVLIDRFVVEGDGRLQRYADNPLNPNTVYDIDNVSDGTASFSCGDSDWSGRNGENKCPKEIQGQEVFFGVPHPPAGEELRINRPREDGTHDAFRIPLLRPAGQHGIYNSQSFRVFDADAFMVNFTARFLGTRGRDVSHETGCDCSASQIGQFSLDGIDVYPALIVKACGEDDLNVCSAECAEAWGIITPEASACATR